MPRRSAGRLLPIPLFLGMLIAPAAFTAFAVSPAESEQRDEELLGYMEDATLPPELRQQARQVMELRTTFNADAIARNSASQAIRGRVAVLRRQCSGDTPKMSAESCTEKTRALNAAIERDNALARELADRRHDVESAYQALHQLVDAYFKGRGEKRAAMAWRTAWVQGQEDARRCLAEPRLARCAAHNADEGLCRAGYAAGHEAGIAVRDMLLRRAYQLGVDDAESGRVGRADRLAAAEGPCGERWMREYDRGYGQVRQGADG